MSKAALFDMDGLMIDTERIGFNVWVGVGRQFGYEFTAEILTRMRGTNNAKSEQVCKEIFGKDFDYDALHNKVRQVMHEQLLTYVPHRPGLVPLLTYLKNNGYKLAVASSTNKQQVIKHLQTAEVLHFFDVIIGGDMVQNSKPMPDIYIKAANEIGEDTKNCLAFEDSFNGVKSASSAGCRTFMVPDMDEPTAEIAALCEKVFESLQDVIIYLEEKS